MIETIAGSFFSGLLSSASFYLRCFIIEYKGNDGKVSTLLIPLDLINLPNFLRTVIERSRLKRSQQSRLSLFAEWVKAQPNELITSQEQILRPTTMDPNVDITKPLLIILGVGFIAIFLFLISEYRMW